MGRPGFEGIYRSLPAYAKTHAPSLQRAYLYDGPTPTAATIKKYGSIYIPLLANISAAQVSSLKAAGVTVLQLMNWPRRPITGRGHGELRRKPALSFPVTCSPLISNWYDFGFMLGVVMAFGGGAGGGTASAGRYRRRGRA